MTPGHRSTDPDAVTIDRKVPLWGVLGVVGALLTQAVIVWNGQNLQASEIRHQSEQIQDLAQQVKGMSAQIAIKDGIDIKQDLRIGELDRRVTVLEEAKGGRR